jgi:hypothetical protein
VVFPLQAAGVCGGTEQGEQGGAQQARDHPVQGLPQNWPRHITFLIFNIVLGFYLKRLPHYCILYNTVHRAWSGFLGRRIQNSNSSK